MFMQLCLFCRYCVGREFLAKCKNLFVILVDKGDLLFDLINFYCKVV